jgi:uncharacterized protein DUF1559
LQMGGTGFEAPMTRRVWVIVAGIGAAAAGVATICLLAPSMWYVIWIEDYKKTPQQDKVSSNLGEIGRALRRFEKDQGRFPAPYVTDAHGHPLLSWRVLLLPYLGHKDLFDSFRLQEAWSSEHNLRLLHRMPAEFGHPKLTQAESDSGLTLFRGVGTGGSRFGSVAPVREEYLRRPLLVVEVREPVIWTKPEELIDLTKFPIDGLGRVRRTGFFGLFDDWNVGIVTE